MVLSHSTTAVSRPSRLFLAYFKPRGDPGSSANLLRLPFGRPGPGPVRPPLPLPRPPHLLHAKAYGTYPIQCRITVVTACQNNSYRNSVSGPCAESFSQLREIVLKTLADK